jgi:hypothetical protein
MQTSMIAESACVRVMCLCREQGDYLLMLTNPRTTREYGSNARAKRAPVSFINLLDSRLVDFSRAARVRQLVGKPPPQLLDGEHAGIVAPGVVPLLSIPSASGDEAKIQTEVPSSQQAEALPHVAASGPGTTSAAQSARATSRVHRHKAAVLHAPRHVQKE